jgi:cell division protein FtsB
VSDSLEASMMKRIGELKAENARLKAEVERLTKAEDKMIEVTYVKGVAGVGKNVGQPVGRPRVMEIRREIRRLQASALAQINVTSDEASTDDQKADAQKRLAEIRLRLEVLKAEVEQLKGGQP